MRRRDERGDPTAFHVTAAAEACGREISSTPCLQPCCRWTLSNQADIERALLSRPEYDDPDTDRAVSIRKGWVRCWYSMCMYRGEMDSPPRHGACVTRCEGFDGARTIPPRTRVKGTPEEDVAGGGGWGGGGYRENGKNTTLFCFVDTKSGRRSSLSYEMICTTSNIIMLPVGDGAAFRKVELHSFEKKSGVVLLALFVLCPARLSVESTAGRPS